MKVDIKLCAIRSGRACILVISCVLIVSALLLTGCDLSTFQTDQNTQQSTFTGSTTPITYSSNPRTVLIRTFHGGGLQGSLQLGPDVSIYGDGTYLLGLDRQGKLASGDLQQLLNTLVDTYGLMDLKRQQFIDIQGQNATFLELALNNKQIELTYGPFGNQQESLQDRAEYQRLGRALTAITEALKGPVQPYVSSASALLVHQISTIDYSKIVLYWHLPEFTLAEASAYECGALSADNSAPNSETGCLKYLIPHNAILLTSQQFQALKQQLNGAQQGVFVAGSGYYQLTLRPLLPDEQSTKTLAMFGSEQSSFQAVPLHEGTIPQSTPTLAA